MKIIYGRTAIKSFVVALLLMGTQISTTAWYESYFHNLNGAHYKKNCSYIDYVQKIRGNALSLYHRVVHNGANKEKARAKIMTQIKEFAQAILTQEQELLLSIKEKYGMSNALWNRYQADVSAIKKNAQIGMTYANQSTTHDEKISAGIRDIIISLLESNNINPKSINLTLANQSEIKANRGTMAQAVLSIRYNCEGEELIIDTDYIPARITIFPKVNTSCETINIAVCAHEIQHIISQHSITECVLIKYLTHYCHANETEIKQSKEYEKLSQIYEVQAEILAVVNNAHVAHCLKKMREKDYYPDTLYEEHFYTLSTIDMLWKTHEKLAHLNR